MNILLIEDDLEIAASLMAGFLEQGYRVNHAADGELGFKLACDLIYQVIVLDRMLPGADGLTVMRRLRASTVMTPVIYLTTMSGIDDRVHGLEAGGDDYLVKPFAFAELLARVRVLARRPTVASDSLIKLHAGELEMDLLQRTVMRDGKLIELLPQEFRLLEYLVRHENRIVTRAMLLENVWDIHFDPQTSVVESHISRLRAKLNYGSDTDLIQTIRGIGYKLLAAH
ncbi:MAG: response regulator transcription factor [Steroidobacteraceae bacterium]